AVVLGILLWRTRARDTSVQPSESKEETLRPLLSALKASTAQNDASKSRDLVLRWASLHAGEPIRTLSAIREVCSAELSQQIAELEQRLYASDDRQWSDGAALYRAVSQESSWSVEDSVSGARALYPTA
ncbi:MAG: hypothetical protein DWQ28_11740, partial [Proteobacteria bacterium]